MNENKAEIFRRIQLFAGLSTPELEAIASHAVEKRYRSGDVLFNEGEECDGLYVIAQGAVKIYKTSMAGREMTIALEQAPGTVAELPMFDGGAYPASVAAINDVRAILIPKREFSQVCRQYPDVALKVLAVVGKRLRHLVTTLESVTFGSVRQRLAKLLLDTSDQAGSNTFPLPMTHQELASRLGTVREVVSRNLSRFQVEGLIGISERQIAIANRTGLEREAATEL
ncbi:MAG TPA: Crp/Fnr family transcriptional regulator [Bryobacteraceae bacterium]|nr:Crp/Fnr family transcriptional regulator [Bryobacteraceae bacterium]